MKRRDECLFRRIKKLFCPPWIQFNDVLELLKLKRVDDTPFYSFWDIVKTNLSKKLYTKLSQLDDVQMSTGPSVLLASDLAD